MVLNVLAKNDAISHQRCSIQQKITYLDFDLTNVVGDMFDAHDLVLIKSAIRDLPNLDVVDHTSQKKKNSDFLSHVVDGVHDDL